jgi:hypothetical protein
VKFAVRTSGSKIEALSFKALLLSQVPLIGTRVTVKCMLRETAWEQRAARAG